jgi:hypothetical protein
MSQDLISFIVRREKVFRFSSDILRLNNFIFQQFTLGNRDESMN